MEKNGENHEKEDPLLTQHCLRPAMLPSPDIKSQKQRFYNLASNDHKNFGRSVENKNFGRSVEHKNFGRSVEHKNFGRSVANKNFDHRKMTTA